MAIVVFIGIVVLLVISIILIIKYIIFTRYLVDNFRSCNCIVCGKKGSGKDLVFQYVINKRKDTHYANIPYGDKTNVIELKDVSCAPNDYEHIVNGNISQTEHKFMEGKDIYISDIGIYLPSYMDSKLYVKFPSMPVLYALSRQLYDNNIHCNTQNIERGWKALREQADFYVRVRYTRRFFGFLITRMTTYDRYQSAKDDVRFVKSRFMNKYSKADVDIYNAEHGEIRDGIIIQRIKRIKYDTRYFEKVLLKGDRLY